MYAVLCLCCLCCGVCDGACAYCVRALCMRFAIECVFVHMSLCCSYLGSLRATCPLPPWKTCVSLTVALSRLHLMTCVYTTVYLLRGILWLIYQFLVRSWVISLVLARRTCLSWRGLFGTRSYFCIGFSTAATFVSIRELSDRVL